MAPAVDREALETNASDEARDSMRACIQLREGHIVYCHDLPQPTQSSIQLLAEGVAAVTDGIDSYAFVFDLTNATTPSSTTREALRRQLFEDPRLIYVAAFTGDNTEINIVVRLMLGFASRKIEFSISQTCEAALAKARCALGIEARRSA